MTRDELLNDVANARTLAEEGRQAPLIGGAYLVLFGVLLAVTYSLHWAIFTGAWGIIVPDMVGAIWCGFGVVAWLGCALLQRRGRDKPGRASIGNRVDRLLWTGVAITILTVTLATVLRSVLIGDDNAPNAIMAAGFGLYGLALHVTSAMSSQRWLQPFAALAWAASAAMWFFIETPAIYLLAAAAAIVVLLIPGIIQMRREPSALV